MQEKKLLLRLGTYILRGTWGKTKKRGKQMSEESVTEELGSLRPIQPKQYF